MLNKNMLRLHAKLNRATSGLVDDEKGNFPDPHAAFLTKIHRRGLTRCGFDKTWMRVTFWP